MKLSKGMRRGVWAILFFATAILLGYLQLSGGDRRAKEAKLALEKSELLTPEERSSYEHLVEGQNDLLDKPTIWLINLVFGYEKYSIDTE